LDKPTIAAVKLLMTHSKPLPAPFDKGVETSDSFLLFVHFAHCIAAQSSFACLPNGPIGQRYQEGWNQVT
jgi:hypothetical protein